MKKNRADRKKSLEKNRPSVRENLVTALEIPGDLAYREAIITVIGPTQAVIENYRCILSYTSEKLIVLTKKGKVTLCGKRLEIPCYTPVEMQVRGLITGIFLERQ